ncbi:MAG: phosphodiesterase, family [Firmicutes bacterium]|nr:phosphodiesterase, family [Bacillota bacterium]
MRIGVISDTHGDQATIRQVVKMLSNVDMWLHAGDYSQDAECLRNLVTVPVISAKGNCDGNTTAKIDEFVEVGDHRIWLTHGHHYGVKKSTQELVRWGKQYEVNVVIYGHTHVPDNQWHEGILIFNPGSAYGSHATYGILDIDDEAQVVGNIIRLNS